jgi:pimeloyl-ACP methyl ester carboxylesterase
LTSKERKFEVAGLTLAACEWGEPGGEPVLALHGWLDNAASFVPLASRLAGCHIVAVDAAGHGFSHSRSPDAAYNIWQEVGDAVDVADRLGWDRFTMLGHSRGAAVAALLAGTFPERVAKLVLIEGAQPILSAADEAPENLAKAILETRSLRGKAGRVFADRETALAQRAQGFTPVEIETAALLATRSLREVAGGFQWHADQRLKANSEVRFTAEQAAAFARRVEAPTILFLAERSPFAHRPEFQALVAQFPSLEKITLPGGHHMHMEGGEREIAARLERFLELAR